MAQRIPVIQLHGALVVSIQVELSDELVFELKDTIAAEICRRDVVGLVIDVSGVDVLDSFISRAIQQIAQIASLMGVQTILSGLGAPIAMTLVEMGVSMRAVGCALNLEAALASLEAHRTAERLDLDALLGLTEESQDPGVGRVA